MLVNIAVWLLTLHTAGAAENDPPCVESMARLRAKGNHIRREGPPANEVLPEKPLIMRNQDGSYVILVPASNENPETSIVYTPLDPRNPSKGYKVTRMHGNGGEVTTSFSPKPPTSTESVRASTRANLEAEWFKTQLVEQRLKFYGISKARFNECRALVVSRKPELRGTDLDVLAVSYAIATLPTAVQSLVAGAKHRGHDSERVRNRFLGVEEDYDTIADEIHQRYSETLGSLRELNRAGFSELARPIIESALEKI